MPRTLPEWFGATPDTPAPDRVRLRVLQRHGGRCPVCTRLLPPNRWDLDHIVAVIEGGENRESNLQPVCNYPCHRDKTRAEVGRKSRAYEIQAVHKGAKVKRRTIVQWRRFDGTIVRALRDRR